MTFKMKGFPMYGKLKVDRTNTSTADGRATSSPFQKKDDKFKTYNYTLDSVTSEMSDDELRQMVLKQHEGKADKWNISLNTLKKQRNAMREVDPEKTTKENTPPPPPVVENENQPNPDENTDENEYSYFRAYFGHGGVNPSARDSEWFERSSGDPEEKSEYTNEWMDDNVNILRSDLENEEIMKRKNRQRVLFGMPEVSVGTKSDSTTDIPR